jgi:addiction module HigA family antidote
MTKKVHKPIHPGEILLTEFMQPMGLTQYRLAKDINVPVPRINSIVLGKRAISADTALRLARYFETTEQFWMNLQLRYELECAKEKLTEGLEGEIPLTVSERLEQYDPGK